ncbi:hypothetical protein AAHC03_09652 [Spirometra sp. Aus1]
MPPVTDNLSFPLKQGNDLATGKALYENINPPNMVKRERSFNIPSRHKAPMYIPTNDLFEGGAGLCRTEEVEVVLEADRSGRTQFPYGFSLQAPPSHARNDEPISNFPVITNVVPSGPAYQSGVIQPGDLLMSIQGDSPLGKSIDKLNARYSLCDEQRCPSRLAIVTQYTVADNVIPNCGVFDVRIIKRSASLGINLQASMKSRPGEPLLISKVIPGSVASRCGSISPGDILLAVNGVSLEACGINEAVQLLQNSDEIVTLRIKKPGGQSTSLPRPSVMESASHNHQFQDCSEGTNMRDFRTRTTTGQFDASSASDSSENLFSESVGWSQGLGRLSHCQRNSVPRRTATENASCAATAINYTIAGGHNAPGGVATASEATLEEMKRQTCSHPGDKRPKSSSHRRSRAVRPTAEESGSSELRVNASETSSSDWFSEAFSSDKHMEILRVRLTRPFPSCPWGIIISGTDDVNDAPVVIDSLTPGKPGAISGLLRPGDQILAVNDVSATRGLTLSQVMARLQLPSEQVLFYIARPVGEAARQLSASRICSTRDDNTSQMLNVKQQSSSATSPQDDSPQSLNDIGERSHQRSKLSPKPPTSARLRHQNSIKYHQRPSAPNDRFGDRGVEKEPLANYFDDNGQPLHFVQHTRHTTPATGPVAPLSSGRSAEVFHQAPASDLKPQLHVETNVPPGVFDYGVCQAKSVHRHRQRGNKNTNESLPTNEFEECHLSELDRDSTAFNLDDIQCPGCREAVAHEVLLQQRLLSQHKESSGNQRLRAARQHTKLRGRSLEYEEESEKEIEEQEGMVEGAFFDPCQSSATALRRQTRTPVGERRVPRYPSNTMLGVQHSRSDSRLNRQLYKGDGVAGVTNKKRDADEEESTTDSESVSPSLSRTMPPNEMYCSSRYGGVGFQSLLPNEVKQSAESTKCTLQSHRSTEALTMSRSSQTDLVINRGSIPSPLSKRSETRSASRERDWRGWIRLVKPTPNDSFGIGLSEGLSSRGIYVSAIRPNSIADLSGLLQLYDRIIKVNDVSVKNKTCRDAVNLIRRSTHILDLFIHRRR